MATEIVRILEDGVWKTEVGSGGGGGGGSQTIAGQLDVAPPTQGDITDAALVVTMPADPDSNFPTAFLVTSDDRGSVFFMDQYGDFQVRLIGTEGDVFDVALKEGGGKLVQATKVGAVGHVSFAQDTDQLVAFHGASGAAQASAIPSAAGGAIIDAEARAAINALLTVVRDLGLIAT